MAGTTPREWLRRVGDAERRGELLEAVDLAERGLSEHEGDVALQHLAVLALARAGGTDEAARRFVAYGLDDVDDEDVAALGARIAKDSALALDDPWRVPAAKEAAGLYQAIYARTGGYYPGINAATLWLVAGDRERSRALAVEVLRAIVDRGEDSYWAAASAAEAHLLMDDVAAASETLERAARRHECDYGALATTRRQLRMICVLRSIDKAVLEPLAGPDVAHYCGHVIAPEGATGPFPAAAEGRVVELISRELRERPVSYAYGALAAGADLLWAEALLAMGSEVHVVLPFSRDEFVAASVRPAGEVWVERFDRCLRRASSVAYGTHDARSAGDSLFRYGSQLAMGLAVLRASYLDADVRQLAVWDGQPSRGEAGTAIDVMRWRSTGRPATIISPARRSRERKLDAAAPAAPATEVAVEGGERVVRAMLFADIKGFSKLTDEQLPRFADTVLGAFAMVLDRHADAIEHRNTWGDAVYVVMRDVERAAVCALALQDAMTELDLDNVGLPNHLALRLATHIGPVFPVRDPVLDRLAFMGSHVSRTARVEPVTPPGQVYATEPFAAAIALTGLTEISCDYVGHLPAAKDFGRLRMYRLHRRQRTLSPHREVAAREGG